MTDMDASDKNTIGLDLDLTALTSINAIRHMIVPAFSLLVNRALEQWGPNQPINVQAKCVGDALSIELVRAD